MLLVTESAPSNQRGYYGAFAQAGAFIGVILANLALIITSASVSEEFFSFNGSVDFATFSQSFNSSELSFRLFILATRSPTNGPSTQN